MLGAGINIANEKSEIVTPSDKISSDKTTTGLSIGVGYNFNEDLYNSWWIQAFFGQGLIKTVSEDTRETPSKTTTDISMSQFSVGIGKRFSLKSWGLANFTYSPSIIFYSDTYGNDAKEAGLESSSSVAINIINFNILF